MMHIAVIGKNGGELAFTAPAIVGTTAQLIKTTYQDLQNVEDLSPHNPLVNQRLGALVAGLSSAYHGEEGALLNASADLTEERQHLPRLCGAAECAMEKFWADKLVKEKRFLSDFWYYKNYKALWQLEKNLVETHLQKRFVFLGAGALPLSAILAAQEFPHLSIDCVDFDPEACQLAEKLISMLGLTSRIRVTQCRAQDYNYHPDDFVLCASLIEGKEQVYEQMYHAGIAQFLVRDAEGVYSFLYAPSPRPNSAQYQELGQTTPTPECINTSRLFVRM